MSLALLLRTHDDSMPLSDERLYVPDGIRIDAAGNPESGNWINAESRLTWLELDFDSWPKTSAHVRNREMLKNFLALHDEDGVHRFASRYGVLGADPLEPDMSQSSILGTKFFMGEGSSPEGCSEKTRRHEFGDWLIGYGYAGSEPLRLWFLLSRQFRSAVAISSCLAGRSHNPTAAPVNIGDLRMLGFDAEQEDCQPEHASYLLSLKLNSWMQACGMTVDAYPSGSGKAIEWEARLIHRLLGFGLFSHLTYQLYLNVVGASDWYVCSGCAHPYVRSEKAPCSGQKNYCKQCKDLARLEATRQYRRKKSAKRKDNPDA